MACGLPCISTPVGGVAEIVRHRRSGLLVPPENPWALAEAIAELARRPELRRAFGRAGRRRAGRLFDRRRNVAQLHAWLEASAYGAAGDDQDAAPLRLLEGRR